MNTLRANSFAAFTFRALTLHGVAETPVVTPPDTPPTVGGGVPERDRRNGRRRVSTGREEFTEFLRPERVEPDPVEPPPLEAVSAPEPVPTGLRATATNRLGAFFAPPASAPLPGTPDYIAAALPFVDGPNRDDEDAIALLLAMV